MRDTKYAVDVDWAPIYELGISLKAYVSRSEHRTLDLGPTWVSKVRRMVSTPFEELVEPGRGIPVHLLAYQERGRDRSVGGFLSWLAGLSAGELYERIIPYNLARNLDVPPDMAAERDREVQLLTAWDREYFSTVDSEVLTGLQTEADAKRKLIQSISPPDLIELATEGLVFEHDDRIECVLLVPQYHHRPWIIYDRFGAIQLYSYSADVRPRAPGEPSPALLRVVRALSDDSRLRMLHYIAESPRTRNELARLTGLSRSTVHHHTVLLRAAGLIRVRDAGEKNSSYSLRPGAEEAISARLRAFLGETNKAT